MAISLKHLFQSAKADGPDTTLVQPSNWNAEHVLEMATARLIGRTTAGAGAAEEISVGSNLSLSAGSLNLANSVSVTALTLNSVAITATGTEINYLAGVTSAIQTQLNGKQPLATKLTNLAAMSTAAGFVAQTGDDTFAKRSLTAGAGISITNGNGVSGNPQIAVSGVTTSEIAASTLVIESEGISANDNDTTIPTSAAVKDYVDGAVSGLGLVYDTAQTLSGAGPFDFTAPFTPKRITIIVADAVGSITPTTVAVQIGDSGGIETSGYSNRGWGPSAFIGTTTSSWSLVSVSNNSRANGQIVLTNVTGNVWSISTQFSNGETSGSAAMIFLTGDKTLSDVLTTVRFLRTGGGNFASGTINVLWER